MAGLKCPKCGADIPEGAEKCPSCGYEAESPKSGGQLSQEQINQLMAGGAVDITAIPGSEPESPKADNSSKASDISEDGPFKPTEDLISDIDDEKNFDSLVNFAASTSDIAEEMANEIVPPDFDDQPAEIIHHEEREMPRIVLIIAITIIAIALGFLSCLLINGKLIKSGEQAFAEQAADAMQSTMDKHQQFVVIEAYSRIRSGKSECVIFGGVKTSFGTMENHIYRILVENDNPSVIRVFYEFDEDVYNELKDSSDSTDRIQASVMKNYAEEFDRAVSEIKGKTGGWTKADAGEINKIIEGKPRPNPAVSEEVPVSNYSEPEDVEDVNE